MEELKKGISRRNLLKGATIGAAGVAALGLFGCAPASSGSSDSGSGSATGEAASGQHTWRSSPSPSPTSPRRWRPRS